MKVFQTALLVFSVYFVGCVPSDESKIRLNHIQVIGSHNSYKQAIEEPLKKILLAKDSDAIGLDYFHLPINEQLDLGLRSLEIDVLHDPNGGRFSRPVGLTLVEKGGQSAAPYDTAKELMAGGFKVLHVPDIDFRSHCLLFKSCLIEIRDWSSRHPDHLPVIITINPKDSGLDEPDATAVLPFTKQVLDSLDQELLSVFSGSQLITPDMVQGSSKSLREAVTTKGWPLLDSIRGKFLFVFDAPASMTSLYVEGGLKGKPMFPNVDENSQFAAFFIMNDPKEQQKEIQERVRSGFMVRTRADADTREARSNDLSRLKAAIASGAQVISTDYYLMRLSPSGTFQVSLSNGKYESCNPVSAPKKCEL